MVIEVEKEKEEKETGTVLLPEGYKTKEDPFVAAKVVSTSPTDTAIATEGDIVLVNRRMIESVKYKDCEYDIVMENHVVGVLND